MSAIKITPLFKQIEEWGNFSAHFYNYKVCGELPTIFGRDEALDLSDMYHIHLASDLQMQTRWAKTATQHYRTTKINDPNNDYWLIYAFDDLRDEYLLLTITGPDAHNRKEWGSYLRNIYSQMVEPWITGTTSYPDIDD